MRTDAGLIPLANPLRPPLFYEPYMVIYQRPHRGMDNGHLLPRYDVYDTCQPDEPRMERYPESYWDYEEALDDLLECRTRLVRGLRSRILDDLASMRAYHRAVYGWSL